VQMARSLEDAGIPLDEVVAAIQHGALSLDFVDASGFERFAALADETFQQVSDRTGVPFELLRVVREAIGMAPPSPGDRLRDDEMTIVPFIELQLAERFRPTAIERFLRVLGDSTRRMADQEAAWWNSEVIEQSRAAGKGPEAVGNADLTDRIAPLTDQSLLAMYHAHQARNWTANIIEGFEVLMANAGIRSRLERLPAICFLDLTGYTRLTQERGDDAAADLATTMARLVQRSSVQHGGKPIKWLGDGVMFYFGDPGPGVRAALEMVDGLATAGLPPAHVGLHAGPVLYQEGDYYGQTVNLTARIADYARPGEVLVTQAVADASREEGIAFADIGPVELKGVSGTVPLLRAHRA
jgi:adenylate cyclase